MTLKFLPLSMVRDMLKEPQVSVPEKCPDATREAFRVMVAKALMKVPIQELVVAHSRSSFIMVGPAHADCLPEKLLGEQKSIILLGEGLLDLSEEEQADVILPQLARSVLNVTHAGEHVPSGAPLPESLDSAEFRSGRADVKIDAWKGRKAADALAKMWLEDWRNWKGAQT